MKRLLLALLLTIAVLLTACTAASDTGVICYDTLIPADGVPAQWSMGFADEKIIQQGEGPFYIAGYRQGVEITSILDYPRASAVWMDVGGEGVLLIGVDCVALSGKIVNDIRTDLAAFCEESGCASVNIYATHSHAGIDTLGLWGPTAIDGKNDDYLVTVTEACVKAARAAYENRTPGTLYYGAADTAILYDSRDPQIYDPAIHQFRFEPDNGESGIRLLSYGAHPEVLGGDNTLLSRDFPGALADILREESGDAMLYLPAAIGGLLYPIAPDGDYRSEDGKLLAVARHLVDALASITEEEIIAPTLRLARTDAVVPLDNTVFLYYRFLGILDTPAIRGGAHAGDTGYSIMTEVSVLTMGSHTFALLPGEIFPELVTGETLTDEDPTALTAIASAYGHDKLHILGLANDELGYVIPPSVWLTHPTLPYFDTIRDNTGENHYEETNSAGVRTAAVLAEALTRLLDAMDDGGEA